jgi:hypothetical protein
MGAIAMQFNLEPRNLRGRGNTSSIMVCNGASIIRRKGLAATSH